MRTGFNKSAKGRHHLTANVTQLFTPLPYSNLQLLASSWVIMSFDISEKMSDYIAHSKTVVINDE